MKENRIYLLAVLLFIFVYPIEAQQSSIDNDSIKVHYTTGEVIIESFKQNNNISVKPIAATVLSDKTIKDNNIFSIKDVSAFVPNLFLPDYGSKMTSPAYIRGIGSRINAPSVGLYIDGVPYFDRATFDFDLSDVESVEVLRGPQGSIYGRNTMGGIINVFTKSPFRYKETNLNLTSGSHNNYKAGLSHYGSINNKFGYSLSSSYQHSGGYFDNKYTGKKADPMDAISNRIRLSWKVLPRLNIHLVLGYEYSDQDGYPYRVYNKNTAEAAEVDYNARSFYRRNVSTNGLNVEYVTDYFKLSSQSSFQFFDGKQGLDQDFSSVDKYYVDFYHRQQMYSQEFNIKSLHEDNKYVWQFGVFGFHQNYFQTNDLDYRTTKKHAIQSVNNPTEGAAIYHQSTINNILTQGLSLSLGLRYDYEKTRSSLLRTATEESKPSVISPEENDTTSFSQISPKGVIKYSFDKNKLIYFSLAKGYKTGGFNTTAEDKKDRTFDAEHSWCYELGAKSSFFNDLLFLDLSLFYIKWSDQQISQAKPTGQGFLLRNAGKTESKGLELSALVNLSKSLNMQLTYGHTDAKYVDYKQSDKKDYNGNYLPMVPQNTLAIAANYIVNTNSKLVDRIIINGQYTGIGRLYWNDDNDISQPYYGLFSAKTSFVKGNCSFDIWAKNIGSKDYITYYFSAMGGDFVQKGKPFNFGVNMNFKF